MMFPEAPRLIALVVGGVLATTILYLIHRMADHQAQQARSLAGRIWMVERAGLVIVMVFFGVNEFGVLAGWVLGAADVAKDRHPTLSELLLFVLSSGALLIVADWVQRRR